MVESNQIISETEKLRIRIGNKGIINVTYKTGAVIDEQLQEELHERLLTVPSDKTEFLLINAEDFISFSPGKQQKNTSVQSFNVKVRAVAIVAPELAQKLLAHHYLRIKKFNFPCHIFSSQLSAENWLMSFRTYTLSRINY